MNNYKSRLIEKMVLELFAHFPVVAVLGVRQVGKSTLVENLFAEKVTTTVFDPVVDAIICALSYVYRFKKEIEDLTGRRLQSKKRGRPVGWRKKNSRKGKE